MSDLLRRFLIAGLFLSLLAACGPIPKPFQAAPGAKEANPLLAIPDGAGVTVAPVQGADAALTGPLTEAMVAELQKVGIPASSGAALTNGILMEGIAAWRDGRADIQWVLTDPDGKEVAAVSANAASTRQAFQDGDPALVKILAERGAALVGTALGTEYAVSVIQEGARRVAVVGVEGAPGDGNRALSRAMTAVLKDAGVPLADAPEDAALLLAGAVTLEALDDGQERVQILWWLMDGDGTVLGKLDQENIIPAGSLNQRWGGAAYDAALANVAAVQEILDRIDEIRDIQRQATEPSLN